MDSCGRGFITLSSHTHTHTHLTNDPDSPASAQGRLMTQLLLVHSNCWAIIGLLCLQAQLPFCLLNRVCARVCMCLCECVYGGWHRQLNRHTAYRNIHPSTSTHTHSHTHTLTHSLSAFTHTHTYTIYLGALQKSEREQSGMKYSRKIVVY